MKQPTPLAKSLVTVMSVRAAIVRIMSAPAGSVALTSASKPQVATKIRDLATAGRFAMESMKK